MNTNEIKDRIIKESRQNGITLTEDELNAKVLEASQMDPDKLERLSGGHIFHCDTSEFNCDENYYCWSDYLCIAWSKGRD